MAGIGIAPWGGTSERAGERESPRLGARALVEHHRAALGAFQRSFFPGVDGAPFCALRHRLQRPLGRRYEAVPSKIARGVAQAAHPFALGAGRTVSYITGK
jgi:hypothetical protein